MKCHVNTEPDKNPVETNCDKPNDQFCGHINTDDKIIRKCMPAEYEGMAVEPGVCRKACESTTCFCNTDNCNNMCSAIERDAVAREGDDRPTPFGPLCIVTMYVANCTVTGGEPGNDTNPTDTSKANDTNPNPTDDSAGATGEDGPQPTDDSAKTSDEDGPQPTEVSAGSTGEDGSKPTGGSVEEKSTGKAATNSGRSGRTNTVSTVSSVYPFGNLV